MMASDPPLPMSPPPVHATQPALPEAARPPHGPPSAVGGHTPQTDPQRPETLRLNLALEAIRQGNLETAEALVRQDDSGLTLGHVFRLYQSELETRTQQLEDSQHRIEHTLDWFATLFRTLPVAAVLLDEGGLVVDANARAVEELDLARALRAVPVPLRRLLLDSETERRLGMLMRQLDEGGNVALDDVPLRTLEGHLRWADLRFTQLPPRHSGVRSPLYLCTFNDRTTRVEAQRAREAVALAEHRRQLAESASQAKTQLLSRVSHELRTPLNAVLGFSHLLLNSGVPLDEEGRRRVRHIQDAGQHLLAMVDDVLQMNRAEAGQLALDLQPLAMADLARDVLALQEPAAAELGLAVTLEVPAPVEALADRQRTWEVLVNLVSNAIKYNRRGGWLHVLIDQDGRECRVAVRDSGIGLTAEQLAHLYEPFNRLGAERLKISGHGLGLSIARTFAQAMGGRLEATSAPGVGSSFTLYLPLAAPAAAQGPMAAQAAQADAPAADRPPA